MTKALKELLGRAARWPREIQEEAFESLRSIERGYAGSYTLTAEDKKALERSAADVRKGRFASSRAVLAFFKKSRS